MQDRRDYASFHLNLSRTGGDVVPYRVNGRPAFLINHPEHVRHVLASHEDRYHNPYHPYRELAPFYTTAGARLLRLNPGGQRAREVLEQIARELALTATGAMLKVLQLGTADPVNVDLLAKTMMFTSITRLLFGVETGNSDAFVRAVSFVEECWVNEMVSTESPSPGPLERRYRASLAVQNRTAEAIARAAGIVLGGEKISPDRTTAIVRTLLNTYNATATALCWLMLAVATHGAVAARLYDEIDSVIGRRLPGPGDLPQLPYTRMVVMETLRLYPPAWAIGRVAVAPDRIGETMIPPAAVISISPYALQRDARFWESPNAFLPERFASGHPPVRARYAYLPFGSGRRRCPAARLNVGHLQIVLAAIVRLARIEGANQGPIRPRGLVALRPDPPVLARFTARS